MALRDYELVYIVAPSADEAHAQAVTDQVGQLISRNGGEVFSVNPWGRRRLAYPIQHFREGFYVVTEFRMEPKGAEELERGLKLSEDILRHLLVRKENPIQIQKEEAEE
ncbi:MAG: 30S ribosomal protein S6 [Chloroflexi bacterium]|nr:30S ribosomal protein S6 [Chloroflexota bacterium]